MKNQQDSGKDLVGKGMGPFEGREEPGSLKTQALLTGWPHS